MSGKSKISGGIVAGIGLILVIGSANLGRQGRFVPIEAVVGEIAPSLRYAAIALGLLIIAFGIAMTRISSATSERDWIPSEEEMQEWPDEAEIDSMSVRTPEETDAANQPEEEIETGIPDSLADELDEDIEPTVDPEFFEADEQSREE